LILISAFLVNIPPKSYEEAKNFIHEKYPQDLNFNSNYILTSSQAIAVFLSHKKNCGAPACQRLKILLQSKSKSKVKSQKDLE